MTYTITQLLSAVRPKLGGSSSSDIADFNTTVWLSALRMMGKIDVQGTKRSATLSSPIYDAITRYPLPSDFRLATDLYPQTTREGNPGSSNFSPTFSREFSLRQALPGMAIDMIDTIPVLDARREPSGNVITLDDFDATTGWAVAGDGSGIYSETLNIISGNAALGFNLSGATGSATLTKSTLTSQDLSTWRVRDSVFCWLYMPSVMTTVAIKRGSSAANYYSKSVTTQQDGSAFVAGWNLLRFDMSGATQTGTANLAATTYVQFTFTYAIGTVMTGVIIDSMTDQLGDYYKMDYYSKYIFRDPTTNIWMEQAVDGNTLINVDVDAFPILTFEVLSDLITELEKKGGRGSAAQEGYNHYASILGEVGKGGLYDNYARKYPSERIAAQQTSYVFDV